VGWVGLGWGGVGWGGVGCTELHSLDQFLYDCAIVDSSGSVFLWLKK
jgi:hypothetical protein